MDSVPDLPPTFGTVDLRRPSKPDPDLFTGRAALDGARAYVGGAENLDAMLDYAATLPGDAKASIQEALDTDYVRGVGMILDHAAKGGASLPVSPFSGPGEHFDVRSSIRRSGRDPNEDPMYLRRLAATPHNALGAMKP